jgi:D-3-phosphoglycerate dehydrogenase / 2-oxoglutarate reductase
VRHLDKVGVLARVLELLREAGLNVEHMQNRIFAGGEAAVATIDVAGTAPTDLLAHLAEIPEVLGSSLVTLEPTGPGSTCSGPA